MTFKEVFEKYTPHFNANTGAAREHRHMKSVIPDVSSHSQSGGRTVPKYCQTDNNNVQEFEALKNVNSGTKVINAVKAQKLKKQFNIKNDNGTLGNTGITIQPHTQPGLYILQK
jgi:hypothetical protein